MNNRISVHFRAMNTDIEAQLIQQRNPHSDSAKETRDEAGEYAALVKEWFEDMETRLSRFNEGSELNRLNRAAGSWMLVSDILFQLLAEAEAYRLRTDGLFNVNVLAALQAAGYDRSFEHAGQFRPTAPFKGAILRPDEPYMEMDARMKAVRLRSGVQLDLGGIAKSWSVRKLSDWLRRRKGIKRGLINAGGDAMVWDDRADGGPAELSIQNPWDAACSDAAIRLYNGGVATSNTLGRSWETPQGKYHHLIDPRGMRPSGSDVVQCTISGPDVTACEVWAKVLCIAGLERGTAMLAEHAPSYEGCIYMSDGSLRRHQAAIPPQWNGRRVI